MKKMNRFLTLNIVLCLISLSCKAQVEIVKEEPSADIVDGFNQSIRSNNAVGVSNYIKDGRFPVNYKPPYKMSPLDIAIDANSVAVIKTLIDNGLNMSDDDLGLMLHANSVDSELFSHALSIASHKDKIDVAGWDEKYSCNLIRSGDYYIKFRLIILYGFDIKNMSDDEERTEFYMVGSKI